MSRYLYNKFKGVYRVKAFYDEATNDFPRLEDGSLDPSFDDMYIPCASKSMILHHERDCLMAIIPSTGRGHNIIKALYEDKNGKDSSDGLSYEEIERDLKNDKWLNSIEDNDGEYIIYFNVKMIDTYAKYLKPHTSGANISPFSTKNLPKGKYDIPESDNDAYKKVISKTTDLLSIGRIAGAFLQKHDKNYKTNMRKECLKPKQYIHKIGLWNEYLDYLEKAI